MSGFNWLLFIPVLYISRKPVSLSNTYRMNLTGHLGINKFQSD